MATEDLVLGYLEIHDNKFYGSPLLKFFKPVMQEEIPKEAPSLYSFELSGSEAITNFELDAMIIHLIKRERNKVIIEQVQQDLCRFIIYFSTKSRGKRVVEYDGKKITTYKPSTRYKMRTAKDTLKFKTWKKLTKRQVKEVAVFTRAT